MPTIKRSTREELKKIMDGMVYHCLDLSEFIARNISDPYFDTEEGKKMRNHAVKICAEHSMVMLEFMMNKNRRNVDGDLDGDLDIEKILKDML